MEQTGPGRGRNLDFRGISSILFLAVPAMVENISQVFIGVVDTYFVGKLGTEAIAGVGVTNLTMNVYIAIFMALGIGTTAVVSRYTGAGDYKKVSGALSHSVVMSVAAGFFFGLLNLIFAKGILNFLGVQEVVMIYALPYFMAVAVPSVFLSMNMVLSSALRGAGDTRTPMRIALLANVINAELDYVLIFGIAGFGGMGVLGAGLATSMARMVSVLLLLRKFMGNDAMIRMPDLRNWRPDVTILKSIAGISVPAAAERLIMRSGQVIYGGMIIKLGTAAYAAHNIAASIESLSYLPGMGFGVAAATLVGQSLGKGNKSEARRMGLMSYVLSTILMVLLGAAFYVFAPDLAGLFTRDPDVSGQVVQVLRIIALFQPFLGITLVITAALQGAGDTKYPMFSSAIGIWGIRVLGVYVLSVRMGYGLVGVWMAYAADITVRGILLLSRYLKGKWKEIQI